MSKENGLVSVADRKTEQNQYATTTYHFDFRCMDIKVIYWIWSAEGFMTKPIAKIIITMVSYLYFYHYINFITLKIYLTAQFTCQVKTMLYFSI